MPDAALASASDHLFTAVVIIYALAMVAFAADTSFGRRLDARRAAARAVPQRTGVPVLVGAPAAGTGPADGETPPAGDRPRGSDGAGDVDAASAVRAGGRLATLGLVVTAIGWLVHVAEVVTRGIAAGRVPWGDMYEFSSAVCLVAVTGFLLLAVRQRARYLGVFVMVPVVLYLGLAGTVLYAKAGPLQPVLQSYWLKIHVVAAITATGAFMVAGVASCLHLVRRRYESALTAGSAPRLVGLGARLPAGSSIERLEHRVIAFAFPIWSFAVIAGAIWAESAWGRYWGWDPKETGSFITWVIYAAYLHARATPSFRRTAPVLALLGFAALLFNYYVINLVVAGLHSYAGLS
ncbi:MAG: c-type cytochrome biogenesis protein CcsB [Frankiaceae bacterium]